MPVGHSGVKTDLHVYDVSGSVSNVLRLLARREVSPQTKNSSKKLWGEASKSHSDSIGSRCEAARDARHGLVSW